MVKLGIELYGLFKRLQGNQICLPLRIGKNKSFCNFWFVDWLERIANVLVVWLENSACWHANFFSCITIVFTQLSGN